MPRFLAALENSARDRPATVDVNIFIWVPSRLRRLALPECRKMTSQSESRAPGIGFARFFATAGAARHASLDDPIEPLHRLVPCMMRQHSRTARLGEAIALRRVRHEHDGGFRDVRWRISDQ